MEKWESGKVRKVNKWEREKVRKLKSEKVEKCIDKLVER